MTRLLRHLFFLLVVRPLAFALLGINLRHGERLPKAGPAIVAANHNSHLDTLVLMTLFPRRLLGSLRPVAAADYFLRTPWLAWFALNIIGILPIGRLGETAGQDPLAGCSAALDRNAILILFPEGTRGEPERLAAFKSGVAHLARRHPAVPVIPVFLHGLGKALPRGHSFLVPFYADVFVGERVPPCEDRGEYMARLEAAIRGLAAEGQFPEWD